MMKTFQQLATAKSVRGALAFFALAGVAATDTLAAPTFYSTSDPSHWAVRPASVVPMGN
jgi:uncharacterized membrane protein